MVLYLTHFEYNIIKQFFAILVSYNNGKILRAKYDEYGESVSKCCIPPFCCHDKYCMQTLHQDVFSSLKMHLPVAR